MKIKDLQTIQECLFDLYDFAHGNCDGDESGIYEEMSERCSEAIQIIRMEKDKIYLKNAIARVKRKNKNNRT